MAFVVKLLIRPAGPTGAQFLLLAGRGLGGPRVHNLAPEHASQFYPESRLPHRLAPSSWKVVPHSGGLAKRPLCLRFGDDDQLACFCQRRLAWVTSRFGVAALTCC
jgi:hypothetical protein